MSFTLEISTLNTALVVVGSRAKPRSVTNSSVPGDVIRTEDFTSQGSPDLANQLRAVVPSFNVNIQPISDAETCPTRHVRDVCNPQSVGAADLEVLRHQIRSRTAVLASPGSCVSCVCG